MADVPILPQARQDRARRPSRRPCGELIVLTDRFQVGGRVFEAWEIETIEDLT
jgi:hypothetical protein